MVTFVAIAMTCWLCALIATPGKPLAGNEVQELVYARLLGRRQWLVLLAVVVTACAFFLAVAMRPFGRMEESDTAAMLSIACTASAAAPASCATIQPGSRVLRELQGDGRWIVVATFPAPTGGYGMQHNS